MGQKVNPISFRLATTKNWLSSWIAEHKGDMASFVYSDYRIRKLINTKYGQAGIGAVLIERRGNDKMIVHIETAKPGILIGKHGVGKQAIEHDLKQLVGDAVRVEITEIQKPDINAALVAQNIAEQLQRRIAFRRAMKRAMENAMKSNNVHGVQVQVSGRLGGAEIARTEVSRLGSVPKHTIRANIDYAIARASTTYGVIGVKVWINKGEDLRR